MKKYVVFNAESAYFYFVDPGFRSAIHGAEPLMCDSGSLSLVLSALGIRQRRLHGPDFMHIYLTENPHEKIMIVGGSQQAHRTIADKYSLSNTAFCDREIDEDDLDGLFFDISSATPSMIFVCLGLGKQERVADSIWLHFKPQPKYNQCAVVGVGAAVDFLGGTKARSGTIWQRLGLEWLPRLIREPRMFPRLIRSVKGCYYMLVSRGRLKNASLNFATEFPAR